MIATMRTWIMDGHNMIFALPWLKRLQESDHGPEARRGLEERLRRFAEARHQKVLVVYDGNDLEGSPDVIREPFLEVVYSRRSEGGADSRIVREARSRVKQGRPVTVVTDDLRTLAVDLPKSVLHMNVQVFWQKHIEVPAGFAVKRIDGDFSDIEREMMARAAAAEAQRAAEPAPPTRGGRIHSGIRPASSHRAAKWAVGSSEEVPASERIRHKREKGRLRQERRLRRRAKPDRRR